MTAHIITCTSRARPIGLGFVCASEVETLGGGLYRVYFGVYGAGEIIGDDVYDLLPEQAALLYPNTPFQGCAVIPCAGTEQQGWLSAGELED